MNRRDFLATGAAAALALPAARAASPEPAASAWGTAELRKLGAWDVHAHVGTPGPNPAKRMEALVRIADRVGVERLCIFMSPPWQHEPKSEEFRRSNDDVLAILKEWGSRAFGFVYLNPVYTKESLAELERCVVGVRSVIRAGSRLENTVMMGADRYERPADFARNRESGLPDVGVGPGCHIRRAIIDKNARIGADCRLSPAGLAERTETAAWYVRDGVLVVKKNAVIAPGTVVGE